MEEIFSFYKVEKVDNIAWVSLNRPEKRNALGPDAWRELPLVFHKLDQDDDILAIIISGEGHDFCAGIDLPGMREAIPTLHAWDMSARGTMRFYRDIFPMQDTMSCIEKCPKPVIGALHGNCIGAGLDMASACDIRLASEDTKISLRETAVAFVADVGSLQRLPHIIGQGHTRELAYTAKFIDARRAQAIHLVNDVYPDKTSLLEGAKKMALEIAQNAPLAVQSSKEVLNYCRGKSIADGLEYVAARSAMIIPSDDLAETMRAFSSKQPAKFSGT